MPRGGRREGAGRKPKPKGDKQRHSVTVKLTDGDLAAMRRAAGEEPLGSYLRRMLLRSLRRRKAGGRGRA